MEQCDILLRRGMFDGLQGSSLLAYADRVGSFDGDADAWLCSRFGVARQQSAPFSAMGDGLDAAGGYWLRSDPVHLALMRDFFVLHGTPADINQEHARQMIEALNLHFAGNGMQWFAPDPGRWYLRFDRRPDHALEVTAMSKSQAVGKKISKELNSAHSDAVLNEIQMLLHQQAANSEREDTGSLSVNSVWLWGGGEYYLPSAQPYAVVMANEPLAKGLAHEHYQPLPESAEYLPDRGACMAVPDGMGAAQFEQKWAAPLLAMLRNNKVQKLVLHLEQEAGVVSYELRRRNLWKFWRQWLS